MENKGQRNILRRMKSLGKRGREGGMRGGERGSESYQSGDQRVKKTIGEREEVSEKAEVMSRVK